MTSMHHKIQSWLKKDTLIRTVVFVALVLLVIAETTVLIRDLHQTDQIKSTHQDDGRTIEPWMTFRYVNTLFSLPPEYLQSRLAIVDMRYPDIEIRRYAKEHYIEQSRMVHQITTAIDHYAEH